MLDDVVPAEDDEDDLEEEEEEDIQFLNYKDLVSTFLYTFYTLFNLFLF
jgi:hypothetical protein